MIKPGQHRKKLISKKLKRKKQINVALILFMFINVIHDSFVHDLPFYYILYAIGGTIIGRIIYRKEKISVQQEVGKITIESTNIATWIALSLIGIRFFVGKIILEEFNVIWASDAIYLVFIGIYHSRITNFINQIDTEMYNSFFKSK
jgi:hypothetical protein